MTNAFFTKGALLTEHQKPDPDAEAIITNFTWISDRVRHFQLPDGAQFFLNGIPHVLGPELPKSHINSVVVSPNAIRGKSDDVGQALRPSAKAPGDLGIPTKAFLRHGSQFKICSGNTIYNIITGITSVLQNDTLVTLNLDNLMSRDLSYQVELLWGSTASVLICIALLTYVKEQTLYPGNFTLAIITLITCAIQFILYVIQQNLVVRRIKVANTFFASLMILEGLVWFIISFGGEKVLPVRMICGLFGLLLADLDQTELAND